MGHLISVVVPVFNNEPSIDTTVSRIMVDVARALPGDTVELVLVDDGSADGSWRRIVAAKDAYPRNVVAVRLSRNFGQVAAVLAGFKTCSGNAAVMVSADLQDPLDLIPKMVELWKGGTEIVIAHRADRHDSALATVVSKVAYSVARAANPRMPKGGFDYLLLSRRALETLLSFRGRHRFFQGDVLWMGFTTSYIPYERMKRERGKSGWTLTKTLKYFIDLMLDSSYLPIRVMSAVGILFALAGVAYAAVIVYSWTAHRTPFEGWAPIMVLLLVIGGATMLMLGILGEYLWRLYDDVRDKPLYLTQEVITRADDSLASDGSSERR